MAIMQTKKWEYLVVGLGQTGMSCANFLLKKQERFALADSRESVKAADEFIENNLDINLFYGDWDLSVLLQACCLIVSPGVSLRHPVIAQAIEQGVRISSDVELFMQSVSQPVLAVTGSNGKSTVVTLLGEMAKQAGLNVPVAGNIGLPVLNLLDEEGGEAKSEHSYIYDAYVLELSSFQLERLPPQPFKCASILNVSADHMDRYESYEEYISAKQTIYSAAQSCVFNRQDDNTVMHDCADSSNIISFGIDEAGDSHYGFKISNDTNSDVDENSISNNVITLMRGEKPLLRSTDIFLQGQHNLSNAIAALAMVELMGWDQHKALETLKDFSGLPHRCEYVNTINDVVYINDSKGTNVGATIAAIEGLCGLSDRKVVLIVGGEGKGADFEALKNAMAQHGRAAICIGSSGPKLHVMFEKNIQSMLAQDMNDAVIKASNIAQKGDYVLLSPACASFDMFKNFEHRGDVFVVCVDNLNSQTGAHYV